jgi:hypothetical protein
MIKLLLASMSIGALIATFTPEPIFATQLGPVDQTNKAVQIAAIHVSCSALGVVCK